MRQIGSLAHSAQAERFTAYLITQGISAQSESDDGNWIIWVRDEDQLGTASQALEDFREDPENERYRSAVREASARIQKDARRREQTRRNFIPMAERWRRQTGGRTPLVTALLGLCVIVFFISSFGASNTTAYRTLAFADPVHERDPNWRAEDLWDRTVDIRQGEVWRLLTPIFMHASPMHLVFNLIMFHLFGTQIESRRGPLILIGLILFTGIVSNAAQGLAPSDWGLLSGGHRFLGLSGVVYGLLGYLWMKTVHEPGSGLFVSSGTVTFLVIWMVIGFTGALEAFGLRMANLAHLMGLLSGMAAGYLPALWRKPL